MSRLSILMLGPLRVTLDGQPVVHFESNKARGLLAYLVVEPGHSYGRSFLSGLLWPDSPDCVAHSNLRHALADVRHRLCDTTSHTPFILAERNDIQFNPASDTYSDMADFTRLTDAGNPATLQFDQLVEAVRLYRGEFLEGLALDSNPPFEEWLLLKREQYSRRLMLALRALGAAYERRGDYAQAEHCARQQVEREPLDEVAQQQLMRALALQGDRTAALRQYNRCRNQLMDELGVLPADSTQALCQSIRDDSLHAGFPDQVRSGARV